MNIDKAEGKFDQVAGKVKQRVGEAVGNEKLANAGVADQIKGAAKETWGRAKDTANTVNNDEQARVRVQGESLKVRAEEKAHDIREKITSTAQNVKGKVNEKLDEIKHKHQQ
jgi:uncharacterized protein YjbJ (UPF0337 family)